MLHLPVGGRRGPHPRRRRDLHLAKRGRAVLNAAKDVRSPAAALRAPVGVRGYGQGDDGAGPGRSRRFHSVADEVAHDRSAVREDALVTRPAPRLGPGPPRTRYVPPTDASHRRRRRRRRLIYAVAPIAKVRPVSWVAVAGSRTLTPPARLVSPPAGHRHISLKPLPDRLLALRHGGDGVTSARAEGLVEREPRLVGHAGGGRVRPEPAFPSGGACRCLLRFGREGRGDVDLAGAVAVIRIGRLGRRGSERR